MFADRNTHQVRAFVENPWSRPVAGLAQLLQALDWAQKKKRQIEQAKVIREQVAPTSILDSRSDTAAPRRSFTLPLRAEAARGVDAHTFGADGLLRCQRRNRTLAR